MSFFRRNNDKPLIPPVQSERVNSTSPRPARGGNPPPPANHQPLYRPSNASTYVPSRDGDPYAQAQPASQSQNKLSKPQPYSSIPANQDYYSEYDARDKYTRNKGVGDVYSRGGAQLDQDRNELFSGYNPEKAGSGRFFDGPDVGRGGGSGGGEGGEEDEDVEGIKQQTRYVKQESVNSTRNALRLAREAEETARNTLGRLGDQSEKLANTERHLDVAKGHSVRADDRTDELKRLNRSIFRPVITFNKDKKRAAQEAKIQARFDEEREEREKAMMDVRDTQNRLGRAQTYGRGGDEDTNELMGDGSGTGSRGRVKTQSELNIRKEQRKRYQFESNASDDEMEDELDDNLDEIGEATKRLKMLGMAMNTELDVQNKRIDTIDQKTSGLDNRLFRNTERLKKVK